MILLFPCLAPPAAVQSTALLTDHAVTSRSEYGAVPWGKLFTLRIMPSSTLIAPKFTRKPSGHPEKLEVRVDLPHVDIGQRPARFHLHNEAVRNDEVWFVRAWDDESLVTERERDFLAEIELSLLQLVGEASGVRRFEAPGS